MQPALGSSDGEGDDFSLLCPLVSIYTRHRCDRYFFSGVNGYRRKWHPEEARQRIPARGFCAQCTAAHF